MKMATPEMAKAGANGCVQTSAIDVANMTSDPIRNTIVATVRTMTVLALALGICSLIIGAVSLVIASLAYWRPRTPHGPVDFALTEVAGKYFLENVGYRPAFEVSVRVTGDYDSTSFTANRWDTRDRKPVRITKTNRPGPVTVEITWAGTMGRRRRKTLTA